MAPVGRDENKVFIMSSNDFLKLAEVVCDTDYNRHCTGDRFVFKNKQKANIDTRILVNAESIWTVYYLFLLYDRFILYREYHNEEPFWKIAIFKFFSVNNISGILITSNNESPPTSHYMPIVTFNQEVVVKTFSCLV